MQRFVTYNLVFIYLFPSFSRIFDNVSLLRENVKYMECDFDNSMEQQNGGKVSKQQGSIIRSLLFVTQWQGKRHFQLKLKLKIITDKWRC